jgi:hypothetical protein
MKVAEFLKSDDLLAKVREAQTVLRQKSGTGKIVIVLDHKEGACLGGGVEVQFSTGRLTGRPFQPE